MKSDDYAPVKLAADSLHDRARTGAGLMPAAEFVSLPGLDHNQAGACSDLVLPVVMEFMARVEENAAARVA